MDQTLSFTYNPSGQVHTQTNSNPAFDPALPDTDQNFVHDGLNRITAQDGAGFTYDSAGNLKTAPGRSYGYDRADRLISVKGSRGSAPLSRDPASRLDPLSPAAQAASALPMTGLT